MYKIKEKYAQLGEIDLNLNKEITLINCDIAIIVKNYILSGTMDTSLFTDLLNSFLEVTKYTALHNTDFNADEILQSMQKFVDELVAEFSANYTNAAEELCYLIGTQSEIQDNYTIVTKMTIILALAKVVGLEFDF